MFPQEGLSTGLNLAENSGEPSHNMQLLPMAQEDTDPTHWYLQCPQGWHPGLSRGDWRKWHSMERKQPSEGGQRKCTLNPRGWECSNWTWGEGPKMC